MLRPVIIAVATAAAVAWIRRGGARHVVVSGASMVPTLRPGDRLVLIATIGRPRPGRLALVGDPRSPGRELLKRVHGVDGGAVDLRGDNHAASTDSRTFGTVPVAGVRAYVALRYAPTDRAGMVRGPVSWWRAPAGRRRSPTPGRQ